jgi:hypothetical protein
LIQFFVFNTTLLLIECSTQLDLFAPYLKLYMDWRGH